MKKVLVISTSIRNNSNSEILAKELAKGAADAGHEVQFVSLKNKKIGFCMGCFACQKIGQCVIKDDAIEITKQICDSDVIVWATPIYYYEMAGQMKTMIDRANSLYSSDYKFREVYFLSVAAEDEETTPQRALSGLEGWIDCFEHVELKGNLFVGGVNEPGEILKNEKLHQAYVMGRNI